MTTISKSQSLTSVSIKDVTLSIANSQKKDKSPKHVTLFSDLRKELWAPYRNSTAKFKIRTRLFQGGHPRYQSRPATVTLSVANSKNKYEITPHCRGDGVLHQNGNVLRCFRPQGFRIRPRPVGFRHVRC